LTKKLKEVSWNLYFKVPVSQFMK